MKCQKCKTDAKDTNFCKNCNIDILIYNKIIRISNNLYNKALYEALSKNLSYSIELLNKSIYFNKNNYNSRNLLGLIYFHLGRVGEALKHWIISSSIKKEDNIALKYIKIVEKNQKDVEILNTAICMYNQSLIYINQKNDDLAIIQLKKCIELSPNFLDAINLLSFCYLIQNKKLEAKNLIMRSLKIDNNNKALYYYKELFPKDQRLNKEENIIINKIEQKNNSSYFGKYNRVNDKVLKKRFGEGFSISEIISFLLGIIFTSIFIYILIIPGVVNSKDNKIIKLENKLNDLEKKYKIISTSEKEKLKKLEEEKNILILENEKIKNSLLQKEFNDIIKEINNYYLKTNYEKAADILEKIDKNNLNNENIKIYEDLKSKIYKTLSQIIYKDAVKEYNIKNYDKAKEFFEKIINYLPNESKNLENVIYYLAKIAENNNEKNLSIEYYKQLIEKYPNSVKAKLYKDSFNILSNNQT